MRTLIQPLTCLFGHKNLIWNMVKRDIAARYKGSVLGILWSFLNPLFMLAIYTFVFKYIFSARWVTEGDLEVSFSTVLFAGLIIHAWLAEVLSRSALVIGDHVNFVKKIRFPLEILPWVIVISSGIQFLMGFCVLIVFMLVLGMQIQLQILMLPLMLLPFSLFLVGCAWILAALGVFLKDLSQVIGTLVTVLLFTSTVFFSLNTAPEVIRPYLVLNPVTIPVEATRGMVVFGNYDAWMQLGVYSGVSIFVMLIGFFAFNRVKVLFADVL
ncbi:ABC transporter permease [Photobacterium sp. BZF1]|uniref:ABC transporter permease n=1 Tax=Photobacterium sp. BZF1 TaxID=1904457 RepID=UPI0016538C62|nr:ABC transporter permease [Photobacterium sp. BZF1]